MKWEDFLRPNQETRNNSRLWNPVHLITREHNQGGLFGGMLVIDRLLHNKSPLNLMTYSSKHLFSHWVPVGGSVSGCVRGCSQDAGWGCSHLNRDWAWRVGSHCDSLAWLLAEGPTVPCHMNISVELQRMSSHSGSFSQSNARESKVEAAVSSVPLEVTCSHFCSILLHRSSVFSMGGDSARAW